MIEFEAPSEVDLAAIEAAEREGCPTDWEVEDDG